MYSRCHARTCCMHVGGIRPSTPSEHCSLERKLGNFGRNFLTNKGLWYRSTMLWKTLVGRSPDLNGTKSPSRSDRKNCAYRLSQIPIDRSLETSSPDVLLSTVNQSQTKVQNVAEETAPTGPTRGQASGTQKRLNSASDGAAPRSSVSRSFHNLHKFSTSSSKVATAQYSLQGQVKPRVKTQLLKARAAGIPQLKTGAQKSRKAKGTTHAPIAGIDIDRGTDWSQLDVTCGFRRRPHAHTDQVAAPSSRDIPLFYLRQQRPEWSLVRTRRNSSQSAL